MRRVIWTGGLAVMLVAAPGGQAAPDPVGPGVLPDLQTVVPKHLGIQNAHQREILRFTNGIANRGTGDLRLRPEPPPGGTNQTTDAVQEILDVDRNIAEEHLAGTFEYHPEHNHWHVGDVARFEVRIAADDGTTGAMGPVLANDRGEAVSVKTSFCLIDWYKLDDNRPVSQLEYFACETGYQGISPGYVDQYHQSIVGQQLDITGAPPGVYYLLSTANPLGLFVESDLTNNAAWVSFALTRHSRGNPKIRVIANSPCDTPGMCGEQSTNR